MMYVLLGALYFASAKLGMLTTLPEGMAVLWPPNGVVLAALLSRRVAPLPWLPAVVMAAELAADVPAFTPAEALCFGALNYLEVAFAYALLRRLEFDPRFSSPADLLRFVLAAPGVAAFCAALGGALVYVSFRPSEGTYVDHALTYWLGDALGLLIVTPLLLSFPPFGLRSPEASPARPGLQDALVWSAVAAVLAAFWLLPDVLPIEFGPMLLVPGVLYAVGRYPQRWAALAVFASALVVVLTLLAGRLPFGPLPARVEVLRAQEFIFLVALVGLGSSSLLAQLRARREELRALNASLEATVAMRTAELRAANEDLSRLALVDPLTGVANRRRFEQALADEAGRAQRHGLRLALVLADIDHFKRINDMHGHAIGDEAIRAFAGVLRDSARASDLVARFGGEEFAVVLPHAGLADALAYAERARGGLARLSLEPIQGLTASFGVAELHPGMSPAALLAEADRALYAAKAAGRDRVHAATALDSGQETFS